MEKTIWLMRQQLGLDSDPLKWLVRHIITLDFQASTVLLLLTALISHACLVQLTANGVGTCSRRLEGQTTSVLLMECFYTDPTSNKPTFSNFSPASNAATDIVAFVNDNPQQMFEVMSADTGFQHRTK